MTIEQFETLTWAWIAIGVIVFFALLFITAPYGRHTSTTWGPLIDNRVGWFVMEFFVLVVLAYFLATGTNTQSITNWVMIGLFSFHYLNRSLVFPFRLQTKGKKMPLSIMTMGMFFNLMNGLLLGYYFGELKVYENEWLQSPQFIIGMVVFLSGMTINWQSDTILINLRKPGETGYKIPQGGLFKYISCPNLFGEVMEWFGFAVLTWSLPGFAFFVWTFANLTPRAIAHHKWYLSTFDDYPKERKAVFPYLW
jgi:3-oxo-5-alpha-steroid 4-dehydrogenase 1